MRDNNMFNLQPGNTVWLGGPSAAINLGDKGPGPVTINLGDKSPRPVERVKARVWKVEDAAKPVMRYFEHGARPEV